MMSQWKPYAVRYKSFDGYVDWIDFMTEDEAISYMLTKRYHGRSYTLYYQPTSSSDKTTVMNLSYGDLLRKTEETE